MTALQIYLFGPPRLEREGEELSVNRRKMLALLAYLLVTRQPHSRETLATMFWPDFDTSSALGNLRRDLSRLKDLLGEGCLIIERDKIQAAPDAPVWVDVTQFEMCIHQVEEHGHFQPTGGEVEFCEYCLQLLDEALHVYPDHFLAGFSLPDSPTFDDWQFFQSERLRGLLATALAQLAGWRAAQGAYDDAIECARRWLALDPLHEPAQRLVMRLYAWAGQPTAALRQYNSLVELLERELDVQPEAETTDLYEAIRARRMPSPPQTDMPQGELPSEENTNLPQHPGAAQPARVLKLPVPATPLVGRENELAQLHDLLLKDDCRLITLVGTGGIGKTRLAIETANRTTEIFPQGAVFVPLASLDKVELIPMSIANAMQLRFSPGSDPKDQLIQRLSGLKMLLVLDNFEHLLDGAGLLAEIIAASPDIRLMVTSRERLNLLEEWIFEVGGLPFPRPGEPGPSEAGAWANDYGAVQLFVERAQRAAPNLQLNQETLADITRICQLVEGMPLAIELAVPWTRAMSCKEIANELERGLDLLTTTMRDLPDRHRSVRLVFEQSWQTLSPGEQGVLAKMSVFQNGCTREAAEKVAGARPAYLMTLVDKALLRHRGERYEMHELVRQYAAERLKEDERAEETAQDQHRSYYLDLVTQALPWLKGGRQVEASNKITADIHNIRSAWSKAVLCHDHDLLSRAAEAYWLYNEFNGFLAHGEAAFREAAEACEAHPGSQGLKGFLLAAQGSMLGRQWRLEQGCALMRQGIELMRADEPQDTEKIAFATAWYAFLNVMSGQFDEAARSAQESLACYPQTGDQWTLAGALRLSGAALLYQGQLQLAQDYLNRCVEVCKSIGELRIRTYATSNLGVIHLWYGRLEEARQYFEEAIRVSISCNDRLSRADALLEYGRLFLATGEFDQAIETAKVCIHINRELGRDNVILANILLGKALLMKGADGAEEALMLGLETARAVNQKPDIASGLEGLGSLAVNRKAYDQAIEYYRQSYEIWLEIGNEPEIATLSCRLAHAMMESGSTEYGKIRELFAHALQLASKHQAGTVAISAMVGLAAMQMMGGELSEAHRGLVSRLLGLAREHPATPQEVRGWVRSLLQKVGEAEEQAQPSVSVSWQTLAEDWERQLSTAWR